MALILKNLLPADIEVNDIGLTVPASSTLDVREEPEQYLTTSTDLRNLILSGSLIFRSFDDDADLSMADSLTALDTLSPFFTISPQQLQADVEALAASNDFHSGYETVVLGLEITVEANKQMVNFECLNIDGTVNVDGTLIFQV